MKYNFLLPIFAGTFLIGSALVINTKSVVNKDAIRYNAEEAKEEGRNAAGYAKWMQTMRANQVTGLINPDDIIASRNEADALMHAKKTRAFPNLVWEERGPNNQGGRTRALQVDVNNPNRLYMGSAGGGLWISNDNGNTWMKSDSNDVRNSSAVCAITQLPNGHLFYGTGESFVAGSGSSFGEQPFILGDGIYKSTDNGASFSKLPSTTNGASAWRFINRMASNGNKLFVASNAGLQISTDEGATWTKPSNLNSAAIEDVKSGANNVMASTSSSLFISTDGGATFVSKMGTGGLPTSSNIARVECAIAPSDENIMYVVLSKNNSNGPDLEGVYKSTNAGATWTSIGGGGTAVFNPLGFQGTWGIGLGVSPLDPNMVYLGGQFNMFRYNPTTATWEVFSSWLQSAGSGKFIHADMHGVVFNPVNKATMYVICDGGFFRSMNSNAANINDVIINEKNKNYATYQCYGVSANRLGTVTAGAQDNGTMQMRTSNANSIQQGNTIGGGDGMLSCMSDIDPNVLFTSIYEGAIRIMKDGGINSSSGKEFTDIHIDADQKGDIEENQNNLAWTTPMFLFEKNNKSVLFVGTTSGVWMCPDVVATLTPTWFKIALTNEKVFSIHLSNDGTTVYTGTQNGNLFKTTGLDIWNTTYAYTSPTSTTWNNTGISTSVVKNFGGGRVVTSIAIDGANTNMLVTLANYGNTDYVYKSPIATLSSSSFTNITNSLPKAPIYSALFVDGNSNDIMVGGELGVWGSSNGGTTWQELNRMTANQNEWHPRTLVTQMVQKNRLENAGGGTYDKKIIYTGTHGRGTFMTKTMANYWAVGTKDITQNAVSFEAYPNPATSTITLKYNATNTANTLITIYDMRGAVVKTIPTKTNTGENKTPITINELTSGAYVVSLNIAGEISALSFVKK